MLVEHLVRPVLWHASVLRAFECARGGEGEGGVTRVGVGVAPPPLHVLSLGPGSSLASLVQQIVAAEPSCPRDVRITYVYGAFGCSLWCLLLSSVAYVLSRLL